IGRPSIDIRHGKGGIEGERLGVVGNRPVVVSFMLISKAAIHIGTRPLWIKHAGLIVVGNGAVIVALAAIIGNAPVDVGLCEVPVDGQGLSIIGQRLIIVPLVAVDKTAGIVGLLVVGIHGQGLGIIGQRLVVLFLQAIGFPTFMIGFDAVGRERQRLVKRCDGLVVRAFGQRRDTALKGRFSR